MKSRDVEIKNSDDITLRGKIYQPVNSSKPGVLLSHGLGISQDKAFYPDMISYLYNAGFPVFVFDLSSHGQSDSRDEGLTLDSGVDDIRSAAGYLLKKGIKNIYFVGHSISGFLGVNLQVRDNLFSKMVLVAPALYNYISAYKTQRHFSGRIRKKGKHLEVKGLRIPKSSLRELKKHRPQKIVKNITCPVLFVQGTDDELMSQAALRKAYRNAGGAKEISFIPKADHEFTKLEHRRQLYRKVSDFFKNSNL